jgi:hypothetical protein
MYYPKKVDDIFLSEDTNIFDIEAARRQKLRLIQNGISGTPVILYADETGIKHQFTDKPPITNFPLKNSDDKDAPIMIYEFPISNAPYGLYVIGVDPYRQGKAAYSDSLGSVTVYKRMHDILGEKYQDMVVATYAARPDKKEKWEEQARFLIKMYNGRVLCENDDISFIEYMKAKGDAHYLEKQPDWLREIVPNTTVSREYGIHRSSDKIIDFLHNGAKKYMEDIVLEEKDDQGNITKQITGMSKILDPVFLEEVIQYNEDGNFDRLISFELALALANKMDPIYGKVRGDADPRVKAIYSKKKTKTLFLESPGLFKNKKRKLFT